MSHVANIPVPRTSCTWHGIGKLLRRTDSCFGCLRSRTIFFWHNHALPYVLLSQAARPVRWSLTGFGSPHVNYFLLRERLKAPFRLVPLSPGSKMARSGVIDSWSRQSLSLHFELFYNMCASSRLEMWRNLPLFDSKVLNTVAPLVFVASPTPDSDTMVIGVT